MRGIPLVTIALISAGGLTLQAADSEKPAADGNTTLRISGIAITQPDKIEELLGITPKEQKDEEDESLHLVVVRILAEPQRPEGLRIDPDDFTLIARNGGERAKAMEADELNEEARLEVSHGPFVNGNGISSAAGPGQQPQISQPFPNRPPNIINYPNANSGIVTGVSDTGTGTNPVREIKKDDSEGAKSKAEQEPDPRVAILDKMALHEVETTEPVEGLIYYLMRTKVKSKNVALLYRGPGGRLVIDFN